MIKRITNEIQWLLAFILLGLLSILIFPAAMIFTSISKFSKEAR